MRGSRLLISMLTLAVVSPALAGCLDALRDTDEALEESGSTVDDAVNGTVRAVPRTPVTNTINDTTEQVVDEVAPLVRLLDDGRVEVTVPVPVVVIGFDAGVADALAEELTPTRVAHAALLHRDVFHPEDRLMTSRYDLRDAPMVAVADYRVYEAGPSLTSNLLTTIRGAAVEGEDDVYDGNAVEAWLAANLLAAGVPVDAHTPALVLIHGGDTLPENHSYRYTYPNGYIQPVRVFGGASPVLALDASARPDPFSSGEVPCLFCDGQPLSMYETGDAYDLPQPAGGDAVVQALRHAVEDATHLRLLQGPLYAPSLKPCHDVAVVAAVRTTSVSETAPGFPTAEELIDEAALTAAFQSLMGTDAVTVSSTILQLPVDDPALAAAAREGPNAVRWWIEENWDTYWEGDAACEAYVSFVIFGDYADLGSYGIAMFDPDEGYRVSFSQISDEHRFWQSYDGGGSLLFDRPSSYGVFDYANYLLAHETGHLLGARHPHDASFEEDADDHGIRDFSFSSTWSAMSYQTDDRLVDFGAIDANNLQRARAGYVVAAALEAGLEETATFAEALDHLAARDWDAATNVLRGALE